VGHAEHRRSAPRHLTCALLTVSDSRRGDTDESGALLRRRLEAAGHRIAQARLVPDEPWAIAWALQEWSLSEEIDAIVITGGTGAAPRDRTPETVESLLDVRLDGFGERFRARSVAQVGSAAVLSRAVAGVRRGKIIFVLPGSPQAVELALDEVILPEIGHLAGLQRA
jgi:molybdenum cofactor biosynthesis protein B